MNYLKQLQAFRDYQLFETKLSSGQVSLYYALLQVNNKCAWIDWFDVSNQMLETLSGLSRQGINKNRNVLMQLGLINFKSNGKQKATSYSICKLYDEESVQSSLHSSVHNSLHTSLHSSVHNSSTITKHKHKQNKTNKDSHDSIPAKRVYEPDDINLKLANYLLAKIRERNSSIYPTDSKNPPDTQKWANDIRLMHERDARSYDDIKRIIEWCQQDSFWQNNILSTSKLRKQFGKLIDKADAPNNFSGNKGGRKPLYDLPY